MPILPAAAVTVNNSGEPLGSRYNQIKLARARFCSTRNRARRLFETLVSVFEYPAPSDPTEQTLFRVASSPIHGWGLFARAVIPADTFIGVYWGPVVERDGEHVLWVEGDGGEWRGVLGVNQLRYLNHSQRPNAEFDQDSLYSLRTIHPGEEITIDYGDDWTTVD